MQSHTIGNKRSPTSLHAKILMSEAGVKGQNYDDHHAEHEQACAFDIDEDEDPLGNYGYGVLSFFDLIRNLIYFFIILSLLYLPLMMYYSEWNGVQNANNADIASLQNFGEAETKCKQYQMNSRNINIGCQTGKIAEFTQIGLYNTGTQAAEEDRCHTQWNDKEQEKCLAYSSHDFSLYKLVSQ